MGSKYGFGPNKITYYSRFYDNFFCMIKNCREVMDVDVWYSEELAKKGDKDGGKTLYQIQYEDVDNEVVFLDELKEILVR